MRGGSSSTGATSPSCRPPAARGSAWPDRSRSRAFSTASPPRETLRSPFKPPGATVSASANRRNGLHACGRRSRGRGQLRSRCARALSRRRGGRGRLPVLTVEGLETSYGQSQVLFGVDLEVRRGEVVTLLGRNGMGKTTTIRSIMGMTAPHGGSVTFEGRQLRGLTSFRIAKLGLGLVPEGRCIFPSLTVWENLTATAGTGPSGTPRWTTDAILELFPWIRERRSQMGGQLSGGEQQMLAIARALMTNPELLILDETTEGLAPTIRGDIWKVLAALKRGGQSILIVDKNLKVLARLADRHYVLERGRVRWSGDSGALGGDYETIRRFVGL